ncbi:GntR family transcriptional regulator [Streptomyces sp. NPDC017993]|uniref:GntR family transcriptional regulator n=1 Tax=Streptomyces sp. NPDC017993 TaxID=3365027 RepID=UPI0037905F43
MQLPLEDDPRPPYVQAAEVLRRQIRGGLLKPGNKLPSARELQTEYGIASSTVQNALRVLRSEGLIYSVQGRGSFVRSDLVAPEAEQPSEPDGKDEEQRLKDADDGVAEGIELAPSHLRSEEFNTLAHGILELSREMERLRTLITEQARESQEK